MTTEPQAQTSERERLVASLLDSALEKANDYDCESNVFDEEKAADMLRADAEKIRALEAAVRDAVSALDDALGDTDPVIDAEATDEEVRDEQPVFWACQCLSAALAATQSPRSEAGEGKK